jgi:hypothetical protein
MRVTRERFTAPLEGVTRGIHLEITEIQIDGCRESGLMVTFHHTGFRDIPELTSLV